jgi:hypothetical protein
MTDLPRVCFPLMLEGIDSAVLLYKAYSITIIAKYYLFFHSRWVGKEGREKNEKYTRFEVFKELCV